MQFKITKKLTLALVAIAIIAGTAIYSIPTFMTSAAVDTTKTIVMKYPRTREVWKKATNVDVRWEATGFKKANKVSVYLSKDNNLSRTKEGDILISKSKPAYKGIAKIAPKAIEKVPYGEYYVKIGYMPKGKTHVFTVSPYKIEIAKRPAPVLTITSPVGGEKWVAGSKQRITWTANFRKGRNKDEDTKKQYAGAKVVPTYGIDKGGNSLDLLKIPAEDRAKLLGLPQEDLLLLSRIDPDFLSLLDPLEATKNITGLSSEGVLILAALSPTTFVHFATLNFASLGAFNGTGGLKMLEAVINPLSFATGSIFGDDDEEDAPQVLSNTIYLQKKDGTDIKLRKGTVEKGTSIATLNKNIEPGTYRLHIVSKLSKKFSLDSYSEYFTVIAPVSSDDKKAGYISVILPNSPDDIIYTNNNAAVRWTTSFAAGASKLTQIRLYNATNSYILEPTTTNMKNDGFELVKIPGNIPVGSDYKIEVSVKDGKDILIDSSDGLIKVEAGVSPTPGTI